MRNRWFSCQRDRLKNSRGETLVEVLASILIVSLSVALLFSSIASAVRIDKMAQASDEAYYRVLAAAERQAGGTSKGTAQLMITGGDGAAKKKFSVNLYGEDGLYAYQKGTAAP